MSKSAWGVVVSFAITVLSVAVPIPERFRGYVILAAVTILVVAGIQYLMAHRRDRSVPRRLRISCRPEIEGCVKPAMFVSEQLQTIFFRVKVEAVGRNIQNCTGFLTRVEKNGAMTWGGDNAQLTFAPGEAADRFSKTLRNGVPEFLDVLAITSRNELYPGTFVVGYGRIWPYGKPSLKEVFPEFGDYVLTVAITGDDVRTEISTLKFTWTQDWQSTALVKQP